MTDNRYKTLDDLRAIIADVISEGVSLEYKGSNTLTDRDINSLCKTVTALANSVGGQFVIGIESKDGKPIRLDGGVAGASRIDWIHKIINANTFPPVDALDIVELEDLTGSYYIINVFASVRAPHQSNDKRYYKRRGSHSEPMEHYEIEDVRNRPKQQLAPLRVELFTDDQLAFLRLKNEHASDSITDMRFEFQTNFPIEHDRLVALQQRGLRELRGQVERYYILDTVPTMLSKNPEAQLNVTVRYKFHETLLTEFVSFFLADLTNSAIMRSPVVKAINALGEKIDRIYDRLEKLRSVIQSISRISDATGLRLSQRSVSALKGSGQLFSPHEFDCDGYEIILNISRKDALALDRIFGFLDKSESEARYRKLAPELRTKFEKYFRVEFD